MRRLRRLGEDLPLGWKLLLPFLLMLLTVGSLGAFVLVRDQATRAQTQVDDELEQRALEVRSIARDRELYLVESGTFAANLQGMAEALQRRDVGATQTLLQSVMALKADLVLASALDPAGNALAQYSRPARAGAIAADPPASLAALAPVAAAIRTSTSASDLGGYSGHRLLLLAAPVCPGTGSCKPTGFTVVGIEAGTLLLDPQGHPAAGSDARLAVYDLKGQPVAAAPASYTPSPGIAPTGTTRMLRGSGAAQVATMLSPYTLQGRRAGTIAVTLPTAPAYASVRAATTQLVALFIAVIAGTVLIVGLITASLLRRLDALVATNRSLAAGRLDARAPASGNDELGQLARGVNQMAASLQESHATLEARVDERTAAVRRLLEERTEFFTAVSHEFRTPLAIIQATADMLSSDAFDKGHDWNVRAAESITEANRQLLGFVNDILDLSRAERGQLDLHEEDVDLAELLAEVQPAAETLASTAGLQVEFSAPTGLAPVRGDRARLRQVIVNLVDNAVKYTPSGGRVSVDLSPGTGANRVVVTDSGVGIPSAERDRVFEPFYRVKSTEPQNGQPSSGVGLALVRRIVEAHGGSIRVDGADGGGSVFTVSLPAVQRPPQAVKRGRQPKRVAARR